MFLEDITQEYLDSITNDILYRKDYMLLSLISLDRQIANLRAALKNRRSLHQPGNGGSEKAESEIYLHECQSGRLCRSSGCHNSALPAGTAKSAIS